MHLANKAISTAAMAMLVGIGALAATAGSASARVVCNSEGDCWHTDQKVKYPPTLGVTIHPDDWYFHQDWAHDNDHHYRDYHEGRGYYKGGLWITL
jgi:hypothetical protein